MVIKIFVVCALAHHVLLNVFELALTSLNLSME